MRPGLLLIVLFLCQDRLLSQSLPVPVFISSETYSKENKHALTIIANPAALASLPSTSAAAFGERLYLLPALNHTMIAAALVTNPGNFGLFADHFGSHGYSSTMIGLVHGKRFGKIIEAGIRFGYYQQKFSGYGNYSAVSIKLGTIFHLNPKLSAGCYAANPPGLQWSNKRKDELPAVYAFGCGYDVSSNCFISIESVKTTNEPVNVSVSLQYQFHPRVFSRLAIQTANGTFSFGVGYEINHLRVELQWANHPVLGFTPGILFVYHGKKKEE